MRDMLDDWQPLVAKLSDPAVAFDISARASLNGQDWFSCSALCGGAGQTTSSAPCANFGPDISFGCISTCFQALQL